MEKDYFCKLCNKKITHSEACHSSVILRRKLRDGDPRILDVWYIDYCRECAENFDPYPNYEENED